MYKKIVLLCSIIMVVAVFVQAYGFAFTPVKTNVENITSGTEIDKLYGKFALCTTSERMNRGSQPSDGWQTSLSRDEAIIHYDGENNDYIGMLYGGTIEGAIRLTPMELGPYNSWNLTSVLFYHGTGSCTGMLKIYGQGTPSFPGNLISSEPYSVSEEGWLTIDLSSPVTINASQDIWVSRTATNSAGDFPLGVDAGPAVDGKGDWLNDGGCWVEMQVFWWDWNWNIRAIVTSPVGVEDDTLQVHKEFALGQNYPNPFSNSTTISFNLATGLRYATPRQAQIKIYNIKGQLVRELLPVASSPDHPVSVVWDGRDEKGKSVPSGIYLYLMTVGDFTDTKKCIILK